MRKLSLMLALVGSQLAAVAPPAEAAALGSGNPTEDVRMGAFVGARLRISLDAHSRERLRAGFALAPAARGGPGDGSSRLRLGEGLELGVAGSSAPTLSLGGRPINRLARGGELSPGRRANISTAGWVGIGAAVLAIGAVVWVVHEMNDCDEHDDEC